MSIAWWHRFPAPTVPATRAKSSLNPSPARRAHIQRLPGYRRKLLSMRVERGNDSPYDITLTGNKDKPIEFYVRHDATTFPAGAWAADFQFDSTTDRRLVKVVPVVDELARECLGGLVARSITSGASSPSWAGWPWAVAIRRCCAAATARSWPARRPARRAAPLPREGVEARREFAAPSGRPERCRGGRW
jgi:hypothetical protein